MKPQGRDLIWKMGYPISSGLSSFSQKLSVSYLVSHKFLVIVVHCVVVPVLTNPLVRL